jgi:hypothetical protein
MRREIRFERESTESRNSGGQGECVSVIYDGAILGVVLFRLAEDTP